MQLDLTLDPRDLRRLKLLAGVSRLAAAKALTFTAEKSVPAWVAGHRVFKRRNGWIDRGIRMRPATPGNLNARVGTIDKYMGRHVQGVAEEKQSAGAALFVPNKPARDQGTHTQTRRQLAGFGRTQRKPFIIRTASGKVLLVRRKGKARLPLLVLGSLRHEVDIPERLDALGIVTSVTRREFGPIYERLLLKWAESGRT